MAAARKEPAKKAAATKATRKAQNRARASKVSKATKKATKPQDAAGTHTSGLQNPYRAGGGYWASVEALAALGVGMMHPFAEIVPAVKKATGDSWKSFAEKNARSEDTGKDAEHRILQNVSVLARKDYGKPLREIGYEVRWNGREKTAGCLRSAAIIIA